jgi:hypothetical protein
VRSFVSLNISTVPPIRSSSSYRCANSTLTASRAQGQTSATLPAQQEASTESYATQQYRREFDQYQQLLVVGPQTNQSGAESGAQDRGQPGVLVHLPGQQRGMASRSLCMVVMHVDTSYSRAKDVGGRPAPLRCCGDDLGTMREVERPCYKAFSISERQERRAFASISTTRSTRYLCNLGNNHHT